MTTNRPSVQSLLHGADGRLHAPVRVVLFLLVMSLCVAVAIVTLKPVLQSLERLTGIAGTTEWYGTAIALLLAHWVTFLTFDKRPWSFVWLGRSAISPRPVVAGFVLGAAPIGIVSLLLLNLGFLDYEPTEDGSWLGLAARSAIVLLPAALGEELLTRGYLFATLREWIGARLAIVATSVGFGLLHLQNPHVDALSIALVTIAGVYLAVVLLATESMYAVWMGHFAWNWTMAAFLHVPVSGIPLAAPDYQIADSGPDWLTGGRWGPEGGIAAGAAMILVMAYVYVRGSRQQAAGNRQQATGSRATLPQHDSTDR